MIKRKQLTAMICALLLAASGSITAFAAPLKHEYSKANDSRDPEQKVVREEDNDYMGTGYIYSDQHPDVTDPEYLIKKFYCYPGESDSQEVEEEYKRYTEYGRKIPYNSEYNASMKEALPLLQHFVRSFDWIHSDERTRYEEVFRTVGHYYNGNTYEEAWAGGIWANPPQERFLVLRQKRGVCQNFSDDFAALCNIVGLECVTYLYSVNHQANLVKIGDQWYAVDPTNASLESHRAVDYDTEYNRCTREWNDSEDGQKWNQQVEWNKQLNEGKLTYTEFARLIYPGKTDEEIEQIEGVSLKEMDDLWSAK